MTNGPDNENYRSVFVRHRAILIFINIQGCSLFNRRNETLRNRQSLITFA